MSNLILSIKMEIAYRMAVYCDKRFKNGFLGLKNCSTEWRSNRDCESRWKK